MAGGFERADDRGREGVVIPLRRKGAEQGIGAGPFDPKTERDELTGLPCRAGFEHSVHGAGLRRRSSDSPWIALAALDGLDEVADPRDRADLVRAVSEELHDSLREGDKLARVAEDRFGLIVNAPYADELAGALERLGTEVRTLLKCEPQWRGVSMAVGAAALWSDEPSRAIGLAEDALELARSRGGIALSTALH